MKNDIVKFVDKKNKFLEIFDRNSGKYMRTGIIENGKDTNVDPFMRSFPGLLDVGIMGGCKAASKGICKAGGKRSGCYQGARPYNPDNDMKLEDYKKIVDEGAKHGLMQIALGGAGNPNDHQYFEEICKYTRENGIVPNYTTAGIELTDHAVEVTKKYCGAVAVSWYAQQFTVDALDKFIHAGCKTNIHYVLSKETIDEAIGLLEKHELTFVDSNNKEQTRNFEENKVNAIIFLLYKPVGLGKIENMLTLEEDDNKIKQFFDLVTSKKHPFKIGFDSCSVPAVLNFSKNIDFNSIDTCEGGRYSAYISANMTMVPCSFDQGLKWGISLRNNSIQEAWDSDVFDNFRNHMRNACPQCTKRENCMGGCPIKNKIVLCNSINRK